MRSVSAAIDSKGQKLLTLCVIKPEIVEHRRRRYHRFYASWLTINGEVILHL